MAPARSSRFFFAFLPLLIGACSSALAEGEVVGSDEAPIINGALDTTHPAVVSLYLKKDEQTSRCSGTIVKTDPTSGIGWVLTAAHCVSKPPVYVYLGEDYMRATLRFKVLDSTADARYTSTSSGYDFAVVRILGVDATTPVMPLLSRAQDALRSGKNVISVGFGRTSASPAKNANSQRWKIERPLNAVTWTLLGYGLTTGGMCFGDSGGPLLVDLGGTEYIAGVHSYVTADCAGQGFSARVASGAEWIASALASPVPPRTCDLCTDIESSGARVCAQRLRACAKDAECTAYGSCVKECVTAACTQGCGLAHPLGEGPYRATENCVCNGACASACGGQPACQAVPSCGYPLQADTCGACMATSCCDEVARCADDGVCRQCLRDPSSAACQGNALNQAAQSCALSRCQAPCGSAAPPQAVPEAGPVPESGAAPTTTAENDEAAHGAESACSIGVASSGNVTWAGAFVAVLLGALGRRRKRALAQLTS